MNFIKRFIVLFIVLMIVCSTSCENPFLIEITDMYTVSFETDCPQTIESYRTKCVEKIQAVQKTGATFEGWYTNASFTGACVSFPYDVKKDTTFYAKWSKRY